MIVPVPSFRTLSGGLDLASTTRYALSLADTWTYWVLVSGPMGLGEGASHQERTANLDAWLKIWPPEQLIAACWTKEDLDIAQARNVQPLVMVQARSVAELDSQLAQAPANAWVYANPRYSRVPISPARLRDADVTGVKMSKVTTTELAAMRAQNPAITIVHGSSRAISESLDAGADLVTAAPLSTLPLPWPAANIRATQTCVNGIQHELDQLPTHRARVEWITSRASGVVSRGLPRHAHRPNTTEI